MKSPTTNATGDAVLTRSSAGPLIGEDSLAEYSFYGVLAIFIVAATWYAVYFEPLVHTQLVAEDRFGEWLTAIAFGWAALLLWFMAWKSDDGIRRFIWISIGLIAFLLAGEEISWGQRVFHIRTPDSMVDLNVQAEMNLHNLAAVNSVSRLLNTIVPLMILGWVVLCLLLQRLSPLWHARMSDWGLPVLPAAILPVLMLPPVIWAAFSWPKKDEIVELTVALAALVWAFDMYLRRNTSRVTVSPRQRILAVVALLFFLAGATQFFCWKRGSDLTYRLNNLAASEYPERGLYAQAETLFRYIESNPQYLTSDTLINHGRMLMQWGKPEEAAEILGKAQQQVASDTHSSESQRAFRSGTIASILGDDDRARRENRRALALIREQSAASTGVAEQVKLLLQEARILEATGEHSASAKRSEKARALANEAGIKINRLR